jgi:hypothetical protein
MSSNEIQLVVPLSALPQDTELTPESVMRTLSDSVNARAEAQQHKDSYNALIQTIQSAGNSLTLILDEVDNEFEKVKALRKFAAELKDLGGSLLPRR